MKIQALRTFVAVARTGSLAAAAEKLNRAPSAVSMTLRQIEEQFGQALFVGERKSQLTPFGAHLLDQAEREIVRFDRTVGEIQDFAAGRAGEVRIASVPSYSVAVMPDLLRSFVKAHPGIRLNLRDLDSETIRRELERERIDIGIVSESRPFPGVQSIPMGSDSYGVLMNGDHPLAAFSSVSPAQVAEVDNFIANPLCERLDIPEVQKALGRARLRIQNTTTLVAMARTGIGITILPELVGSSGMSGIAFRPLDDPAPRRRIDLIHWIDYPQSPAVAVFVDFVTEWSRTRDLIDA